MAVGSIDDGIMPLNQPAVYLGNITGYIEYEFEEDEAFGQHFVEKLGQNQILISHNHGYYALEETAAAAFFRAYFLRQTCSTQIKTLSMGRELHMIDPQKVARYQDQMATSDHYNYNGETEWPGLIRMLDKRDPNYASWSVRDVILMTALGSKETLTTFRHLVTSGTHLPLALICINIKLMRTNTE